MERRSCNNAHFINAIKGSSVMKILNINSRSKPDLVFKKLEDIYENGGLTPCAHSSPQSSFCHVTVKTESQYLPLAVRNLCDVEQGNTEAHPCGTDGETSSDSDDYIFGKMTLKELKKNCKTKKRKCVDTKSFNSLHIQIKWEPEEEDSDLSAPLFTLRSKVSKTKKKGKTGSTSPRPDVKCKSQDIESERPLQSQADLLSSVRVKTEVEEPEIKEYQNMICSADNPFSVIQKDESGVAEVIPKRSHLQVECQSLEPNLCGTDNQIRALNVISLDDQVMVEPLPEVEECQNVIYFAESSFSVIQKDESGIAEVTPKRNHLQVECQSSESYQFGTNLQRCAVDEVSFDCLENVESLTVSSPSGEDDVKDQEKWCQQFLHSPTLECEEENMRSISPAKDQIAGRNDFSRSRDPYKFLGHHTTDPAVETTHIVVNDGISREETSDAGASLHPQDPVNTGAEFSFLEDEKSEGVLTLESELIDQANEFSNNATQLDAMECELSSSEETEPSISTGEDVETTECDQRLSFAEISSSSSSWSSVAVQVPERLLSTRKVVSPTSEERLCLAMNSSKSYSDLKLLDCKEDICNEDHTKVPSLCEKSDKLDNVSKIPQVSVAVNKLKVVLCPPQIRKKAKHGRTSPPKGNLEGPRMTRALPGVNTGSTSIQGCSESAIAFSQRQMQDIEALAMKLMDELKSMKDIVEEKLLFESYRNPSSKHDAEEVKNAITNASKTEEMAKKWLSMMGRDCNRFCKIMSLNQKGDTSAAACKTIQRDRKKITFADETGGMLCHVKFFEKGVTSLQPKQ
ncbi:OLC1v1017952C1 [Oldenlandia corymbosa var. corymbosa]|uniref:OLC1v1017952C1 n=1 Tax=Oldenlandia corymbosa var. corymbosa TaxID=529605 RepID=A0AAV1EAV5_OLDCO|nr:OLC1v1017952C1 [Oldenlandia corymbosa var. corymbosa]